MDQPATTPADALAAPAVGPATLPAGANPSESTFGTALTSAPAHLRLWLLAVGGLALDLWSKDWAFRTLNFQEPRVLVHHLLEFQAVLNAGALFGIGAGYTSVFLVASVLALGLVFWMFAQSGRERWLFHLALGGILAGALGNMYDRVNVKLVRYPPSVLRAPYYTAEPSTELAGGLMLTEFPPNRPNPRTRQLSPERAAELKPPVGYVRDFIKIPTTVGGKELWPWVFNVADMLLVGGVIILAISLWREQKPATNTPALELPQSLPAGTFDVEHPAK